MTAAILGCKQGAFLTVALYDFLTQTLNILLYLLLMCVSEWMDTRHGVDVRGQMSGLGSPPLLLIMGIEPRSLGLQYLPADLFTCRANTGFGRALLTTYHILLG